MNKLKTTLIVSLMGLSAFANAQPRPPQTMEPLDLSVILPVSQDPNAVDGAIYKNPKATPDERTIDLLHHMTFEEKLNLTGGWKRFMIPGIPRLGIRPVLMSDASQGIRTKYALVKAKTTSYPCMIALASTWNTQLAEEVAHCIGEECRAAGVDILLGPGINMQRLSVGGRNYEYMGEDPFLTSTMSSTYIKSLQETGVIATAKHFVCNDTEFYRHIASSEIGERALREIYLLPFERAIRDAGLRGIMTGNNTVNGIPCCMNAPLLQDILREEIGYRGIIMTDWQNTYYFPKDQDKVFCSGLSLLMPENVSFAPYVKEEAARSPQRKREIESLMENMIYPTLYTLFESGIYDRKFHQPELLSKTPSHQATAKACAAEAVILLKNEGHILPLKKGQDILLTGKDELHSGTGSGYVEGYNHITYEQGLRNIAGDHVTCKTDPTDEEIRKADVVLFRINKIAGEGHDVPYDAPADELKQLRKILKLNKKVIVLVNSANNMEMDWAAQAKGIVWCNFLGQSRGDALAGLLYGNDNFSGKLPFTIEEDFNDSPDPKYNQIGGKAYWHGNNMHRQYWRGSQSADAIPDFAKYIKPGEFIKINYDEGIYMGYRWFDKTKAPIRYPFGYGLSYTNYTYDTMEIDDRHAAEGNIVVNVTVTNKGKMAGKEIVQVYVTDPECSVERPEKELKGFTKVNLKPGETKTVSITLNRDSFTFWDETTHGWKLEPGTFIISSGPNSMERPLTANVQVGK